MTKMTVISTMVSDFIWYAECIIRGMEVRCVTYPIVRD
jgi:hypothetical protein